MSIGFIGILSITVELQMFEVHGINTGVIKSTCYYWWDRHFWSVPWHIKYCHCWRNRYGCWIVPPKYFFQNYEVSRTFILYRVLIPSWILFL